jgi:hypothetical protein
MLEGTRSVPHRRAVQTGIPLPRVGTREIPVGIEPVATAYCPRRMRTNKPSFSERNINYRDWLLAGISQNINYRD